MVLKNLMRRKVRTLLTVFAISIGVAAIIGLGTLADGFEAGYQSLLTGSKSDLVISQPNAIDISLSSVDEEVSIELARMPEVADVTGMLEGFVQTEDSPFFFLFGYPEDSFILNRFQIIAGYDLQSREADQSRGTPLLLGSAAAEAFNKTVGESIRLNDSIYRIVGIYQTGDNFEDSGAVVSLSDAQIILGKPRQVSIVYVQLKDPALKERLETRVTRLWPDLGVSGTNDFADKQLIGDFLDGYVWVIAGLAIIIGGVGMMNSQLMSVFERTREIGVLRAVGWSSRRVMGMILGEAILVGLLGGVLGIALGWLTLYSFSNVTTLFGASPTEIDPGLLIQAFAVVFVMGLVGGLYPAWRASRLPPVEALRYEGGSSGAGSRRLPVGGMAVQSLWQRASRTVLTLGTIAITVGAIMALEGMVRGASSMVTSLGIGADVEIMIREADIADTSLSAIDERIGDQIEALPEVENVSGMVMSAALMPESTGFFILWGYGPYEYAIRKFNVVEGNPLTGNHQLILGRMMADALNKGVGDTLELSGSRYRITGIYETGVSWEELGGVVTLRDAQTFAGRPRKLTMLAVKVTDPLKAPEVVDTINAQFPKVQASLAGEFAEEMPDMQNADGMLDGISFLAIVVGGVGVLNTMLMSVFERTKEIGVLRALGWRRRGIMGLILREALILGLLGGLAGILVAIGLTSAMQLAPMVGEVVSAEYSLDVFIRAISIALLLGLVGGLYPALRATRLEPVEAIRYE